MTPDVFWPFVELLLFAELEDFWHLKYDDHKTYTHMLYFCYQALSSPIKYNTF